MKRLSSNEIRARAADFSRDWADAQYEKGESQGFYIAFFGIFGIKPRSVTRFFEARVEKLDERYGWIDLFWPGKLIVEQKSAGGNLQDASGQAYEYFDSLREHEKPRYVLVSDFQTFELRDLDEDEEVKFTLAELPDNIQHFGFILGREKRTFREQDPVNIKASEAVGKLHERLARDGYAGHDLERLLVRIVFCLFAEDTGIFEPRDIFLEWIEYCTQEDGSDLGKSLLQLFEVLNTPEEGRLTNLEEEYARFPYVNGALFEEQLRFPGFDRKMRDALLETCEFDWGRISPAIFGSLFQYVMDPSQRRKDGGHYTTEENILKVIEPLFMDDLQAEFQRVKSRRSKRLARLQEFQEKLGTLKVLDPACGCGNFLVITYREVRRLELEVIREIRAATGMAGQRDLNVATLSQVDVDQFYGIELNEFPARIAETAIWMMDHIMNIELGLEFGKAYARIPLVKTPHIHNGDALEIDWSDVLRPEECTYVLGNPPFGGAKKATETQRTQVQRIANLGNKKGTLDYVAAWFIKAGEYLRSSPAQIAFVTTNSVTQGQQVGQLWPILYDRYDLEIAFAHRTFAWGSEVKTGKAHVHVTIVGLDRKERVRKERSLFSYRDVNGEAEETQHGVISPYLFDGDSLKNPRLTVRQARRPINGMRQMEFGTQPLEGGHLLFSSAQKAEFIEKEPGAAELFRPYWGAREFLQDKERWILHTAVASPRDMRAMPLVRSKLQSVREFREYSTRTATRRLSGTPTSYGITVIPEREFLVIPRVSSERREYVPIGLAQPPVIPSEATILLRDATLAEFALLTSAMHMTWLRYVGGRLKSDYRYSIGLVYNTFPTPPGFVDGTISLSGLEQSAQAVLDARAEWPDSTLADLYDPDSIPERLHKAHRAVDQAVDRLYRRKPFGSERERVEHLFGLYEKMRGSLDVGQKSVKRPKREKKL